MFSGRVGIAHHDLNAITRWWAVLTLLSAESKERNDETTCLQLYLACRRARLSL
jgi:hypothetical protein